MLLSQAFYGADVSWVGGLTLICAHTEEFQDNLFSVTHPNTQFWCTSYRIHKTTAFERSLWLSSLAFTFQSLTVFTRFLNYCHTPLFTCSELIFIFFCGTKHRAGIGQDDGSAVLEHHNKPKVLEVSRQHSKVGGREEAGRRNQKR